MGLVGRAAGWASRRPFSRFESDFYERAGASAVADHLQPAFERRLGGARRVLDVGCGGGVLARRLSAAGREVVGVDPSPAQVDRARAAGVVVEQAGAEQLPFADESFDAVVSSCSIKHWRDRPAGLAECLRVLRPGGPLVVGEIDGDADARRLRRFAADSRVPRGLKPIYPVLYPAFAHLAMVVHSPTGPILAELLQAAGARDVGTEPLTDQPFVVAWGARLG